MHVPSNYPMYIDIDGQYGSADDLYTFKHGELTLTQWENAETLDGPARYNYIVACVEGNEKEQANILGEED